MVDSDTDHDRLPDRKYKLPNYQDGHAYLTSHRVYYVDNSEPRKYSVGIDLKDVDRPELFVNRPLACLNPFQQRLIFSIGSLFEIFAENQLLPESESATITFFAAARIGFSTNR